VVSGKHPASPLLLGERPGISEITAQLSPHQAGRLARLHIFSSLDSTNRYLLEQDRDPACAACLAEVQTAGRGRQGKAWLSPPGGLYLSVKQSYPALPRPGLNLALGIGLIEVLAAFGAAGLGLKWPNDTLWQGRYKLAGILTETRLMPNGPCILVAGVGVNLALPAEVSPDQAYCDLRTVLAGPPPERERLAGRILQCFMAILENYQGFSDYRQEWAKWDILRDQPVRLIRSEGELHGVARGVDEDGALLLETEQGIERQVYGEASVRLAGRGL
jgi:BirA family biotin operon repressor/biotin-[acetyl-CoA-carboxylase] ligase